MARQFIYHMRGLTKAYSGGKKVLENIHLSFYPDAKIGVLGINGAGKSTLLRIMAGIDKDWNGEGWVAEGARVGYLPQEPQLDPTKNVRENVMEGVAAKQAHPRPLQRTRDELLRRDRGRDDPPPGRDRRQGPVGPRFQGRAGHGRPGLPARRLPSVDKLSGGERRRVALCKLLLEQPDLLLLDEPTNHLDAETIAWLEEHLRAYPGAILIVTHDRYFLDNVTGWILELDRGRGIPYEGNYSVLARAEAEAPGAGRPRGRGAPAHHRARARMDVRLAEGPAGQVEGPHPALRRSRGASRARRSTDDRPDRHPDRRAARQQRHRRRQPRRRPTATGC